jgi:hypothetical protein
LITLHSTTGLTLAMVNIPVGPKAVMAVTLWITGFLCLLNIGLAIFFRQRSKKEMFSYSLACIFELAIFALALLIQFDVITTAQVPFHLPAGLPVNQAELAAALAIGLGLFPAAYWHRINLSELPKRIAEDGKTFKTNQPGVKIRNSGPNEWMN